MGIFISEDCWWGSYGSFDRWRMHIAKEAGYGTIKIELDTHTDIDWDKWGKRNLLLGEWDKTSIEEVPDTLYFLIVHSDCEGHIHPEQAAPLADRLEEIINEFYPKNYNDIMYFIPQTTNFINGLRSAVKKDKPLTIS